MNGRSCQTYHALDCFWLRMKLVDDDPAKEDASIHAGNEFHLRDLFCWWMIYTPLKSLDLAACIQHAGVHKRWRAISSWILERLLGNRTGTAVAKGTFISSRFDHLGVVGSFFSPKFNMAIPIWSLRSPYPSRLGGSGSGRVAYRGTGGETGSPRLVCQNSSRRPTDEKRRTNSKQLSCWARVNQLAQFLWTKLSAVRHLVTRHPAVKNHAIPRLYLIITSCVWSNWGGSWISHWDQDAP